MLHPLRMKQEKGCVLLQNASAFFEMFYPERMKQRKFFLKFPLVELKSGGLFPSPSRRAGGHFTPVSSP
jgi:hypothetical protein